VRPSGTSVHLNAVTFIDERNGWVVGDHGTILHSNNGGIVWTSQGTDA